MIKVVGRSGNLASLLRTTTAVGATSTVPIVPAVPEVENPKYPTYKVKNTAYSSACALPVKKPSVVSGPNATFSVRHNHTDVKVPDFSYYRANVTKNPKVKSSETEGSRKLFVTAIAGVGGACGVYSAKTIVTTLITSMSPAANVLALAKIEVKKSDVPEGQNVTFNWRGKPLFVRHRTDDEIKTEEAVNVSSLRDPQHDSERVKDPKWLVVVGVCTHLGCVPIANQGEWGGYYCPCHGSHYDASGRIRKGPAPLNLEVPPYEIVNDLIIVG